MVKPYTPFDAESIIDTLDKMKNAATIIGNNAYKIDIDGLEAYDRIAVYKLCAFFHANERAAIATLSYMRSTLNTQHYGEFDSLISAMLAHLSALILASTDLLTCLNEEYGQDDSADAEIIGHARPDEPALDLLTRALPELDNIARKILAASQDVIDNTPEDNQWKQHPYNRTHPFKTLADLTNTDKKENKEK